MFEQTFRNIGDILWKEAGCATELDYTELTADRAGHEIEGAAIAARSSSSTTRYIAPLRVTTAMGTAP